MKFTVTWKNRDGTGLETDKNVAIGTIPEYNGTAPVSKGRTFTGRADEKNTFSLNEPLPAVTGNVTYTAVILKENGKEAVTYSVLNY